MHYEAIHEDFLTKIRQRNDCTKGNPKIGTTLIISQKIPSYSIKPIDSHQSTISTHSFRQIV